MKKQLTTLLLFLLLSTFAGAQYVGIGTTTPMAPLDVAGDALINGLTVGRGAGNSADNTALGSGCLFSNTTGNNNVATGMWALNRNTTGSNNVANGSFSLYNNTTGMSNNAFGLYSLVLNTTGSRNVAIGAWSLFNNTTGAFNIANGSYSLVSNTIGTYNVAIGDGAMFGNSAGNANIAIGLNALNANTTGDNNTVVGLNAGTSNTTGSTNIFIGASANPSIGNLFNATAIGNHAYVGANNSMVLGSINGVNGADANTNVGIGTTTPQARLDVAADILVNGLIVGRGAGNMETNTVVGKECLVSNTTGDRNVVMGFKGLHNNTTGTNNVASGSFALGANTTGLLNSAFGDDALSKNLTGNLNTGIGAQALFYSTGSENIGVGFQAGSNNSTGSKNIFIGVNANPSSGNLINATAIGDHAYVQMSNTMILGSIDGINGAGANTNVGIGTTTPQARLDVAADVLINGLTVGHGAGNINTNTALGFNCLAANSAGTRNTGIGVQNLSLNTTGNYNATTGGFALHHNTTGSSNSAFGDDALYSNTTASFNTAVGSGALYLTSTGSYNTAIGKNAGENNINGYVNTYIGAFTKSATDELSNATAIGGFAYVGSNNAMVLGSINGINGASANTDVGIGTTTPTARLDVVGTLNATSWKTASMSENGYAEMGGVLLQWGKASYSSNVALTITFPKVFTTVYSVTATVDGVNNSGSGVNVPVKVLNVGNNTFQIAGTLPFSGDGVSKVRWMAVGN